MNKKIIKRIEKFHYIGEVSVFPADLDNLKELGKKFILDATKMIKQIKKTESSEVVFESATLSPLAFYCVQLAGVKLDWSYLIINDVNFIMDSDLLDIHIEIIVRNTQDFKKDK